MKTLETGTSELTKQFTNAAISKMADLREAIWSKLKGNSRAESALRELAEGSQDNLDRLLIYLKDAMADDPDFSACLEKIAFEISKGSLVENSTQIQTNYGGTNFQNSVAGGKLYQANEITINEI